MSIQKQSFGKTNDGIDADLYILQNTDGMIARITNLGGIVQELIVPDRSGTPANVVLGFDSPIFYADNVSYFGCIVGRFANRISNGQFSLNGTEFTLAQNAGHNHLHGGIRGFDKVVWTPRIIELDGNPALELSYLSLDGEEGYPGNLIVKTCYMLTTENELRIDYLAETDQDTILNVTNHSYFNLAGHDNGTILEHELKLNAEWYTPTDEDMIPTGEIKSVKNTPMDFTSFHKIGSRISDEFEALQYGGGYDAYYILDYADGQLIKAAEAHESRSGRRMEVFTTEPGVQLYTGNFIPDNTTGKDGAVYGKHSGFCLETQHYPDSPNKTQFPSTVLRPNEIYKQTTIYKFSVK